MSQRNSGKSWMNILLSKLPFKHWLLEDNEDTCYISHKQSKPQPDFHGLTSAFQRSCQERACRTDRTHEYRNVRLIFTPPSLPREPTERSSAQLLCRVVASRSFDIPFMLSMLWNLHLGSFTKSRQSIGYWSWSWFIPRRCAIARQRGVYYVSTNKKQQRISVAWKPFYTYVGMTGLELTI